MKKKPNKKHKNNKQKLTNKQKQIYNNNNKTSWIMLLAISEHNLSFFC